MTAPWIWAAARAAGTSHLAQGLPCQDAYLCSMHTTAAGQPVLIAAVADGAGSAERAESGAIIAVEALAIALQDEFKDVSDTANLADLVRHAIGEVPLALDLQAEKEGRPVSDFNATLLVAVLTRERAVVAQIGDGAVVVDDGSGWRPIHWPDHGEYANTTRFVTESEAVASVRLAVLETPPKRVCLFSDGLERLLLDFARKSAHAPFFDSIFARLSREGQPGYSATVSQELSALLESDKVNARTDDDKSLVCAQWLE
jgi:hypothetical protein